MNKKPFLSDTDPSHSYGTYAGEHSTYNLFPLYGPAHKLQPVGFVEFMTVPIIVMLVWVLLHSAYIMCMLDTMFRKGWLSVYQHHLGQNNGENFATAMLGKLQDGTKLQQKLRFLRYEGMTWCLNLVGHLGAYPFYYYGCPTVWENTHWLPRNIFRLWLLIALMGCWAAFLGSKWYETRINGFKNLFEDSNVEFFDAADGEGGTEQVVVVGKGGR